MRVVWWFAAVAMQSEFFEVVEFSRCVCPRGSERSWCNRQQVVASTTGLIGGFFRFLTSEAIVGGVERISAIWVDGFQSMTAGYGRETKVLLQKTSVFACLWELFDA